jgi:hypothetical protein
MKILMLDAILYGARSDSFKIVVERTGCPEKDSMNRLHDWQRTNQRTHRVMKYCIKSDKNGGSSFGKSPDIPSGAIGVDETLTG